MPTPVDDLRRLAAIPSIAFDGFDGEPVLEGTSSWSSCSAALVSSRSSGWSCRTPPPIITATVPGPTGAPTVLLYAHDDVQPVGDLAAWRTDPFTPTEIDGALYGREVADDRSNLIAHGVTVRVRLSPPPPVPRYAFLL